jgi:hypothetical protein
MALREFEKDFGTEISAVVIAGQNGTYRIALTEEYLLTMKPSIARIMDKAAKRFLQFDAVEGNG